MPDDNTLVARASQGEEEAFESLVHSYQGKVYSTLFHLLVDRQEVEDVFWEVWSQVYRSLRNFKRDSRFSTWLFSLVLNVVKHRKRRFARKESHEVPFPPFYPSSDNPLAAIERQERIRLLHEAILSLPVSLREPLVCRAMTGLSYEELSKVLHLPVGALKTRCWRAKQLLLEKLKPWLSRLSA